MNIVYLGKTGEQDSLDLCDKSHQFDTVHNGFYSIYEEKKRIDSENIMIRKHS